MEVLFMKVCFDNIIGKIKPMHAVGQPPMMATDCSHFHYLKDANIPYARLHDMGLSKLLPMVDISCVFLICQKTKPTLNPMILNIPTFW